MVLIALAESLSAFDKVPDHSYAWSRAGSTAQPCLLTSLKVCVPYPTAGKCCWNAHWSLFPLQKGRIGWPSIQQPMHILDCCLAAKTWRLTLCDPMDCSLPGSSVQGIPQARILEWVAISFSRQTLIYSLKSLESYYRFHSITCRLLGAAECSGSSLTVNTGPCCALLSYL